MQRTSISRIRLAGAGALSLALVGMTSAATLAQDEAPVTLRLAVADDEARPTYPIVQAFVLAAYDLSDGAITIKPRFDAAGDDFEVGTAQLLLDGGADLAVVAGRSWDQVGVDDFKALQAPFLIDNDALAQAVADSDAAQGMLGSMSAHGLVGLELWPEDLRHPAALPGCADPLVSPEQLAGLDIRVPTSGVAYDLFETLGARPSFSEWDVCTYQAAESGLRQGVSLPSGVTFTGDVTFYPKFQVLAANAAAFDRLSESQRQTIREAAAAAQDLAIATHPTEADAAQEWCAAGGQVVLAGPEGIAAFMSAAQPVYDRLMTDPVAAEAIAGITALKETVDRAPGAIACGTGPQALEPVQAAVGPTPIDGTYVTHVSFDELAYGPLIDTGELNGGNWGDMTLEFDAGTFTYTQSNPSVDEYTSSGPFNVEGDLLTVYDPNACCPPVPFSFRWSLDGDVLTLSRDPDYVGPTPFIVKPWTRVSEE